MNTTATLLPIFRSNNTKYASQFDSDIKACMSSPKSDEWTWSYKSFPDIWKDTLKFEGRRIIPQFANEFMAYTLLPNDFDSKFTLSFLLTTPENNYLAMSFVPNPKKIESATAIRSNMEKNCMILFHRSHVSLMSVMTSLLFDQKDCSSSDEPADVLINSSDILGLCKLNDFFILGFKNDNWNNFEFILESAVPILPSHAEPSGAKVGQIPKKKIAPVVSAITSTSNIPTTAPIGN